MFNSALIETFKTFNKQELKDFSLFIQSPFFNTNQSVVKLFGQIRILYPEFDEINLEKKFLFGKAFGKIKYNDSFMRMTVFRLMELTKDFLIHSNLQRNNFTKETLLLDEFNIRELKNLMLKSISELDKKIDKQKAKDADSFYAKYKLEYYKNEIKSRDTKMITYKDTLGEDMMLEQKSLNTFFFMNSLKFFQYFLNQKNFVVNAGGYPDFINNILEYLKLNEDYLKVPALNIYYNMILMLLTDSENNNYDNNDKFFYELKRILFEDKDDLSFIEKFNLIADLRNYAQKKFDRGNITFRDSMIDIIKFSIDKNILTTQEGGKYISEIRFMNIVWTGIQLKEYDWLEELIKKIIDRIDPGKRNYVLAYSNAAINFDKGNFSKSLDLLGNSGPIKNVFYKAATKQLTLMIYYELKWFIPASDLLDAYRHFIKTDKLLPEIYISKSNMFIKYYSNLLKINESTGENKFIITKLVSELKLTSQQWLLEKAEELLKKSN
jgi:hypothetical protein